MADDSSPETKPKRKWRKRLLWLTGILCASAWALNGPIARWCVHYAIDEGLLSLGMTGGCSVKGTLRTGFTLNQFDYVGTGGIQKLQFSEASADYRLLKELVHGKVRSLSLSEATVVIDLAKFVTSASEEETSIQKVKETINLVREWVRQPNIQLSDIDISLLQDSELVAEFKLHSLHHAQQSDAYRLNGFTAKDSKHLETPLQDLRVSWTDSKIVLSTLEVLPDVTLSEIHADWSSKLTATAQLQLLSSEITVELSDHISAQLHGGSLNSAALAKHFNLEFPLDLSLESLDVRIDNWSSPISAWEITCDLGLSKIDYEAYSLENTKLHYKQEGSSYALNLKTLFLGAPLKAEISGKWAKIKGEKWWLDTAVRYEIHSTRLANTPKLIPDLPEQVELSETSIALVGEVKIADLELISLNSQLEIAGAIIDQTPIPPIQIQGEYEHLKKGRVAIIAKEGEAVPIKVDASYTFENDKYEAEIAVIEKHPLWINKLLAAYDTGLKIENSLNLHWRGSGHSDLDAPQLGKMELAPLSISYRDADTFELTTGLEYQWPESITLKPLQIKSEDFVANAELQWDGQFIHLSKGEIFRASDSISTVTAKLPFTREITSLEKFLAQDTPWLVDADLRPLPIKKINQWFKLSEVKQLSDLQGTVSLGVDLIGSPHKPDIKGFVKLEGLRGIANKELAPLHMLADFKTLGKRLNFSGVLNEATTQRMKLDFAIPFTPLQWVQKSTELETILKESEVAGKLEINTLPLNRIARLVPQLKEITGHLHGEATITGNLLDPKVELDTRIEIPRLVIADDTVDDVSDILIECKANSDRKITANLKATVNGGLFAADAKVDLKELKNPFFEVNAKTDYAMVFRNDSISVRANAKLKLAGNLEDATLSGTIGFVESLFYKDIDILPIGVPSSAVSDVELPAFDSKNFKVPIPEPFDKWKLDLKVQM
ncbi:MAG: hypothetical protein ABGY95_12330, partial [Rubritalea sp.]|uniref:hypothetical protein n=1 Tax=Rubritalea sp. TaxID=2109375 RepID=UPI00324268FD